MSKKIISIFVLACLVLGLLPIAALADTPKTAKIGILSRIEMSATEGGAPAYLKNESFQGYTKEGVENGIGWSPVKGDENNWNIKYEYPAGGVPTVTLKDAKLDIMGDNGSVLYTKKTNAETGEVTYTSKDKLSAILPKTCDPIKIVLQGVNVVEVNYGIVRGTVNSSQYFKDVTIVGENGGKLSGFGRTFNLLPGNGYNLTIENATLNLTVATGSGSEAVPLRVKGGDIIIKNSVITGGNEKNCFILAQANGEGEGGNVTIIDSKITASAKLTSTAGSGVIAANGDLTISGDKTELNLEGKNNPGISAGKCITIDGGEISILTPYYGVLSSEKSIIITGGTIEITAKNAFYSAPTLGAGMDGVAGLAADDGDNKPYEDSLCKKPYVKLSKGFEQPTTTPTTQPTTAPTTAPTGNTTAPTQGNTTATTGSTNATTKATTAATTKATNAPNKAPAATQGSQTEGGNDTVIAIVIVAVVAVLAVVAIVVVKKKQQKAA